MKATNKVKIAIAWMILAGLFAPYAYVSGQTAGTPDSTFNGTGKVVYDRDTYDLYNDVKVQPDGKIVAAGTSMTSSFTSTIEVTRYLADGSFDPSFGTGGHFNFAPNVENGAYKCLIKEDGKILVCGYTTDYTTWEILVIQLTENGVPDPAFGENGVVLLNTGIGENIAYAIALQADGKILVSGYSQDIQMRNVPVVIRFTDTGILDTSFGFSGVASIPVTETDNDFSAVSVQSDGKIIAAGHISNGLSWFSLLIARFDDGGYLDLAYGNEGIVNLNLNNVDDEFYDMVLTGNDEAILAGFTVTQPDYFYHLLMMKFDVNGQPVTAFGTDGIVTYGEVPYTFGDAMAVQPDGKILIAGCTGELMPANNDWALWRYNSDGSPDITFGSNGIVTTDFFGHADEALGIALHSNKIIVAGKTRNATDYLDFAVARYLNDVDVYVPGSHESIPVTISPNPVRRGGQINLAYEVQQASHISVELINLSGNSLLTLSAGTREPGMRSFTFFLPDRIPEGVYVLQVKANNVICKSQKLILLN